MAVFYNQATLSYNNTTVSSNIVTGTIVDVLSASKTAVSEEYSAGEVLTYAVSLVNSGTAPLTGITVTDDLGAYTFGAGTLVPLTYKTGSVKYFLDGVLQPAPTVTAGDTLVIGGITVPAEGNAMIIYQASANEYAPAASGSAITNTATVSGQGVTDITVSATVPTADEAVLSVSKSLSPDEVSANGQLTYTFVIQNTGNTAETGAVLRDTFDPILNDITVTADGTVLTAADYTYDETTGEFATAEGAFTVPAATFTQDTAKGTYTITPGMTVLTVTGTI